MDETTNNVKSLYSIEKHAPGGAGDLVITFSGLPNSGFEYCEPTQQTLARGSQYQTSFLPEMANGQSYKVKVKASYKDYVAKEYILNVQFLPSLDQKRKYLDLGTHIFYKINAARQAENFKFSLYGVTDNKVDYDLNNFDLKLIDDLGSQYYEELDQDNVIDIVDKPREPKIGKNIAHVTTESNVFYPSDREFFALKGMPSEVEVPLVAKLKDGELAVVLTYTNGQRDFGKGEVEI